MAIEDAKEHEFQNHPLRKGGRRIIAGTSLVLYLFAFYVLLCGFWALKASLLAFALGLAVIAHKGMVSYKELHPGSNLMLYAYLQVGMAIPAFVFAIGAFKVPDILASYIGGIQIGIVPSNIIDRINFVGIMLGKYFFVSIMQYIYIHTHTYICTHAKIN